MVTSLYHPSFAVMLLTKFLGVYNNQLNTITNEYIYMYIYKVYSSIFVKKCSIHISRAKYKLLEKKTTN